MAEKLRTADELAQLFGVSPKTIYKWRSRGLLPGYSTPHSRLIRFKESEARKCWEERSSCGFALAKQSNAAIAA